jgi:predicted amidohydrolase
MNDLRVTMIQSNIGWEDKEFNLRSLRAKLEGLSGRTEIVVLPEMFSTGFSMRSEVLAEGMDGATVSALKAMAAEFGLAIAATFICREGESQRNRAIFVTPEGETYHYDKRHLFRMGNEPEHYTAGSENCIFCYRGWRIMMQVCYDLRFPVWCRNTGCRYDLLIYMANWPQQRGEVWQTLLRARALENMAYVCGVNRTGSDGMGIDYAGGSLTISPKGKILAEGGNSDVPVTATLNLEELRSFREKFPAWKDGDEWSLRDQSVKG